MLKSYLKQDSVALQPTQHYLVSDLELDLNVKFPLLCLFQFLIDLKSTIM